MVMGDGDRRRSSIVRLKTSLLDDVRSAVPREMISHMGSAFGTAGLSTSSHSSVSSQEVQESFDRKRNVPSPVRTLPTIMSSHTVADDPKQATDALDDGTLVYEPGSTRPLSIVDTSNHHRRLDC